MYFSYVDICLFYFEKYLDFMKIFSSNVKYICSFDGYLPNCRIPLTFKEPPRWGYGRTSASGERGRGFDPRSGHTNNFKNDNNGCPPWCS